MKPYNNEVANAFWYEQLAKMGVNVERLKEINPSKEQLRTLSIGLNKLMTEANIKVTEALKK